MESLRSVLSEQVEDRSSDTLLALNEWLEDLVSGVAHSPTASARNGSAASGAASVGSGSGSGGEDAALFDSGDREERQRLLLEDRDLHEENGDDGQGRLGPSVVRWERSISSGNFDLDQERLRVDAISNFPTVRANVAVYGGKWMFEVTVLTAGLSQIGFSVLDAVFSHQMGVGDLPDTYAYDGDRQKKWGVASEDYGERWVKGDVIGALLDMEERTVSFTRNGKYLGVAFAGINVGQNVAYFPSVSCGAHESVRANFGALPFQFPQAGYCAFHKQQVYEAPARVARTLMQALLRLLRVRQQLPGPEFLAACGAVWHRLLQFASHQWVVADVLYPVLLRCVEKEQQNVVREWTKQLFLFSPTPEIASSVVGTLLSYVGQRCVSFPIHKSKEKEGRQDGHGGEGEDGGRGAVDGGGEEESGSRSAGAGTSEKECDAGVGNGEKEHCGRDADFVDPLCVALAVLGEPLAFDAFLGGERFSSTMEDLLSTKSPSNLDLEETLTDPVPIWLDVLHSEEEVQRTKRQVQALYSSLNAHEHLVRRLVRMMLERDSAEQRGAFIAYLRDLLRRNQLVAREPAPLRHANHSVFINLFFSLLDHLCDDEAGAFALALERVPLSYVRDSNLMEGLGVVRLGGLLSHLEKEYPLPASQLGEAAVSERDLQRFVLFDICLVLYHILVNVKFRVASMSLKRHKELVLAWHSEHARANDNAEKKKSMTSHTRVCIWNSVVLSAPWKQHCMARALRYAMRVVRALTAKSSHALGYFPQYWLEFIMDVFRPLLNSLFPVYRFGRDELSRSTMQEFVSFLVRHLTDERIANPEVKDILMQQLNIFLATSRFCRAAERNRDAKTLLLPTLLKAASRNWVSISAMLLRFWKDRGFGKPQSGERRKQEEGGMGNKDENVNGNASNVVGDGDVNTNHHGTSNNDNANIDDSKEESPGRRSKKRLREEASHSKSKEEAGETRPPAYDVFFVPGVPLLDNADLADSTARQTALASPILQVQFRKLCVKETATLREFLNQLLNTLNWCISEFAVGISEFQRATQRHRDTIQLQKKCIIMFELSSSLIRLLEIVCIEAPWLFVIVKDKGENGGDQGNGGDDGSKAGANEEVDDAKADAGAYAKATANATANANDDDDAEAEECPITPRSLEINMQRIAETLTSAISRIILSSDKEVFRGILREQNLTQDVNDQALTLPVLGVMLVLFESNEESLQVLSQQSAMQERVLQYLKEVKWEEEVPVAANSDTKRLLQLLPQFLSKLEQACSANDAQEKVLHRIDSAELCPICYASAIDTSFVPCGHTSCGACIQRHLLNSQKCFFCNTLIESTKKWPEGTNNEKKE